MDHGLPFADGHHGFFQMIDITKVSDMSLISI
jgi:hypothetical protein